MGPCALRARAKRAQPGHAPGLLPGAGILFSLPTTTDPEGAGSTSSGWALPVLHSEDEFGGLSSLPSHCDSLSVSGE